MSADTLPPDRAPDAGAWGRTRRRWAAGGERPWLHGEVARRMAERLSLIRLSPSSVLDWDARGGQSAAALSQAYPAARRIEVDEPEAVPTPAPPSDPQAPSRAGANAWWRRIWPGMTSSEPRVSAHTPSPVTVLTPEAVVPGQAELLWSNMGLHTHADPDGQLARWHAALAVDGFLMFSTFGPDTLRECGALWRQKGWGPAAQPFIDMHDWGDALVRAGFADPVMDQETIRLTWDRPEAALAELRTLGGNAHPGRHPGCRTPRWHARMRQALADLAGPDGRIALTFEIVYGHAFRPAPRPRLAGTTTVSLDEMRAMVHGAGRPK